MQQQHAGKSSLGRDSPLLSQLAPGSWLESLGLGPAQGPAFITATPAGLPASLPSLPPHLSQQSMPLGPGPSSNLPGRGSLSEMALQLQAVQGQVVAQQKYIRSLHKWAGSAAAAVRQLQDQSRSATSPVKAFESELGELKSEVAALSNHCASKDSRIDALVQELSDVKAQLVEVERLASELEPHLKRRKLLSSESHTQAMHALPAGVPQLDTDAQQLSGDPPVPREGASVSTDVMKQEVD